MDCLHALSFMTTSVRQRCSEHVAVVIRDKHESGLMHATVFASDAQSALLPQQNVFGSESAQQKPWLHLFSHCCGPLHIAPSFSFI